MFTGSEESSALKYYKIVKNIKYGFVPVFLEQNSGISRERAKHEENAGYDPG